MHPAPDLDAYMARLGYGRPAAPTLPVLRELAVRHVQSIPFESLDPFLGLPVSLALPDIEHKLVRSRRGGYCYEHNRLFGAVLRAIGFDVTDLSARVLWGRAEDEPSPRTHMLLAVRLDGQQWIVDVGFGGQSPTGPLRLQADTPQATPHGPYRLLAQGRGWRLQSHVGEEWRTLYRFDLEPEYLIDYEIFSYYLSTHPQSYFVANVIAARATQQGRLALQNRDFRRYGLDGSTEQRTLKNAAEILSVLQDEFLIQVPHTSDRNRLLDALP